MIARRLSLIAPTRPARDALFAFLAGLEPLRGYWQRGGYPAALAGLAEASEGEVAIAFEDGGLLQSLDAWSNTLLPVAYHAAGEVDVAARRAAGILAAIGRQPEEFSGRSGNSLSLYERRALGFVRAMLVEPQLLVLDRLFEDLGYEEQQGITTLVELFGRRYPLRRMLYVGLTETTPAQLAGFEPLGQRSQGERPPNPKPETVT
jgi:ABC-type taurine transport system ATPase subunit